MGSPTKERAQCFTLKASARRSGCTPVGEEEDGGEGRGGRREGGRERERGKGDCKEKKGDRRNEERE